jgi:two-component system, cell cycle sensor histidine kinase and response regulator CckA
MPDARVLIVEDEAIVALDIQGRLEGLGYEVIDAVANGKAAIELAASESPDIILMDIIIQGDMDGIETARIIIDNYDIPVVFLTANSDKTTIARAKLTGPFGYLMKPLEERDLHTAIELALYKNELEHRIKVNEKWLNTVLVSIGDAVLATDASGIITFMNPVAESLTGWCNDQAVGRSINSVLRLIDGKTGTDINSPVRRVLLTGDTITMSNNTILISVNGDKIAIEDSAAPIIDDKGSISGVVIVFKDISERKKIESENKRYKDHLKDLVHDRTSALSEANKKLTEEMHERQKSEKLVKQSEERYRTLFETMHDGMAMIDLNEKFCFANAAACKIFGYTKDELMGKSILDLVTDDFQKKILSETRKRLKGDPGGYEITIKNPDGKEKDIFSSVSPFRDQDGNITAFFGVITDITEQKRADKEKSELKEKLVNAQKMEALGVLAGGVAHDLNNILGPLVVYPQMIIKQIGSDHPQSERIKSIEITAKRAADVVQDLLTMARRGRYEMEQVEMNNIIESYIESPHLLDLKSRFPNISIDVDLHEDTYSVFGSHTHLHTMIMNLIINAMDAMPEGGKLKIKSEIKYLTRLAGGFSNIDPGKYNVITVEDTGIGIDKKHIDRIFEPFYSRKELGRSGSGLGLAIVYGVVKDHNGYIDVRSELTQGTEFIIYLPVIEKSVTDQVMENIADIRGTELILVVDDLDEQRELSQAVLQSLGYNVKTVENGRKAVRYIKNNCVDVLLLDMIMEPGFDGLDTYREVISFKPNQKTIIVSGYSETDRVKEAEKLGVKKFIKKPYTMQQLGKAIRETLSTGGKTASHEDQLQVR